MDNLILGILFSIGLVALPVILLLMWNKEEPPNKGGNDV